MGIKEKALDTLEIVGKTALSAIPVGGALATSVYDTVKANCLSKRQEKWRTALEERLVKLENTLEEIGNDESESLEDSTLDETNEEISEGESINENELDEDHISEEQKQQAIQDHTELTDKEKYEL